MNNTFNQKLQQAIGNSNTQFKTLYEQLDRSREAAKVALYYAHGNVERNEGNQRQVSETVSDSKKLKNKSINSVNLSTTTLAAAQNSQTEANSATSNVATAAANMQIAANAITKLSSETAGVLAVASASSYDSELYQKVKCAASKIKEAAQCAEKVSIQSLNATIEASQTAAATVVSNSQTLLTSLQNLQNSAVTEFGNESQELVTVNQETSDAITQQNLENENFEISNARYDAVQWTRKRINQLSNHNIQLFDPALSYGNTEGSSKAGEKYTISFRGPRVSGSNSNSDECEKYSEKDVKEYRLMMVPYVEASAFDVNSAKGISGDKKYFPIVINKKNAKTRIELSDEVIKGKVSQKCNSNKHDEFVLSDCDCETTNEKGIKWPTYSVTLDVNGDRLNDINGDKIVKGKAYVAFVYIKWTETYIMKVNNTDGYLSLPSLHTTFRSDLPQVKVQDIKISSPHNLEHLAIKFKVNEGDELGLTGDTAFRVFVVNEKDAKFPIPVGAEPDNGAPKCFYDVLHSWSNAKALNPLIKLFPQAPTEQPAGFTDKLNETIENVYGKKMKEFLRNLLNDQPVEIKQKLKGKADALRKRSVKEGKENKKALVGSIERQIVVINKLQNDHLKDRGVKVLPEDWSQILRKEMKKEVCLKPFLKTILEVKEGTEVYKLLLDQEQLLSTFLSWAQRLPNEHTDTENPDKETDDSANENVDSATSNYDSNNLYLCDNIFPFDAEIMAMLPPSVYVQAEKFTAKICKDENDKLKSKKQQIVSSKNKTNSVLNERLTSIIRVLKVTIKNPSNDQGESKGSKGPNISNLYKLNTNFRIKRAFEKAVYNHFRNCQALKSIDELISFYNADLGDSEYIARLGVHALDNYGMPLQLNDQKLNTWPLVIKVVLDKLAEKVLDKLWEEELDKAKKEKIIEEIESSFKDIYSGQSAGFTQPVSYKALVFSAFDGNRENSKKYNQTYSDFSEESITLYN